MPLMKELVLIAASVGIAHAIARYAWRKGLERGEMNAKKDTQLAFLRGMAMVQLQDVHQRDIIAEARDSAN